jgi:hypothetical protein
LGVTKPLVRHRKTLWLWAALGLFGCLPAHSQDVQFLPETDIHLTLDSWWKAYLQAKDDRDEGAQGQFSIGPSVQVFMKPLVKLKTATAFDLDDAKKRPLVLETGYRYITAPGSAPENRMETVATFHFPMSAGFLLVDRNRADLDWKNGKFSWRYRNKLTVERTFAVHSYHLIPYVAVEPYYTSQYSKWSTTALYAGCLLPVGKHVEFNPYYEHENNTGKPPNKQDNMVGLALYVFFSIEGK